jgi:uncharacterized OB-fold protein
MTTPTPLPNPETRAGQEEMKRMGIVPWPIADDLTRPFWDAANRHELVIQKCTSCGEFRHTPRVDCLFCKSTDVEWVKLSGKGTVFTFIVDHRNEVPGFDGHYVFAFINPVEAPRTSVRLTGNILECDPDDVYIGMPVEVMYKELKPGVTLPEFRPAPEAKLRSKGQTP